jgi:integrase/recombinase XerC
VLKERNVGRKLKPTERDKYVTRPEFDKLLLTADSVDERLFVLTWLGGAVGLRATEALSLRKEALKRLSDNILLVPTLKQKGHPVKEVAVDDETKALLREFAAQQRSEWLFLGLKGKHLTGAWLRKQFKRLVLAAGLNPCYSFHALRHFCGLRLWQGSHDIKLVQDQLRHSDMKMSERYIHMDGKDRIKAVKRLEMK